MVFDNLAARGPRTPEFLIIDGAAGLDKLLAALWCRPRDVGSTSIATSGPTRRRRCTRRSRREWRLKCRALADSLRLFAFTRRPSARTTNAVERLHKECSAD
jgi:hypothetical protein